MKQEQLEKCRADFEADRKNNSMQTHFARDADGYYENNEVENAWRLWCRAWSAAQAQGVDEAGDIDALRKYGNRLAASLEDLAHDNMTKHAKRLFGLQWWEFAKVRIEDWRRYLRALDRDGIGNV